MLHEQVYMQYFPPLLIMLTTFYLLQLDYPNQIHIADKKRKLQEIRDLIVQVKGAPFSPSRDSKSKPRLLNR